jgi:hypothetical protein
MWWRALMGWRALKRRSEPLCLRRLGRALKKSGGSPWCDPAADIRDAWGHCVCGGWAGAKKAGGPFGWAWRSGGRGGGALGQPDKMRGSTYDRAADGAAAGQPAAGGWAGLRPAFCGARLIPGKLGHMSAWVAVVKVEIWRKTEVWGTDPYPRLPLSAGIPRYPAPLWFGRPSGALSVPSLMPPGRSGDGWLPGRRRPP